MLIAQAKDGTYIDAGTRTTKKKDTKNDLFCPCCQSPVILKAGPQKIAHFAHSHGTACHAFSEGESKEHLAGKRLLQQFVPTAQLEVYLPELEQRPDLLANQLALEFQCSPLSFSRFFDRTTGYLNNGYQPVWLFGKNLQPRKNWTVFQKACCQFTASLGFYSYALDVNQAKLYRYQSIKWAYQTGYTWQIYAKKPTHQWQFEKNVHADRGNKMSYATWIQGQMMQCNPLFQKLQQAVYPSGMTLFSLPEWCYQPSLYGFLFTHQVLVFRAYYCESTSFSKWVEACQATLKSWHWPYFDAQKIFFELYQECRWLSSQVIK